MRTLVGEGTNQASRRGLLLGGVAALSLLASSALAPRAAEAAAPSTQSLETSQTHYTECPQGFTAQRTDNILQTVRIFESGRQQTQMQVNSEMTNLTSGKNLDGKGAYMITFGPDQVAFSGLVLRVVMPGEGSDTDTGLLRFDRQTGATILEKGPSDNFDLCNALK